MIPKNTMVEGKLVDIISETDYKNNFKMFEENPNMCQTTAVEMSNGDKTYILPMRGKSDDAPGFYMDGILYFTKWPTEQEDSAYNKDNLDVIDYSDSSNIEDFLKRNDQVRAMEQQILTDIDTVFTPIVGPDDSPEMAAFKTAIALKKCDINKYAGRFGDNFLNDKRILKSSSITMKKITDIGEKLDIEIEITLRDKNPNVPNPIGKEITAILTGREDKNEQ